MDINWTEKAVWLLEDNLDYWINKNKSSEYSFKILDELNLIEKSISEDPYFLAKFKEEVKLYQRNFLNNKFALLYEINEEENLIIIKLFRNNRQRPLL